MLQVERHHHKGNDMIVALCKTSKELYNKCNFLMRHAWFGNNKLPDINDLVAAVKQEVWNLMQKIRYKAELAGLEVIFTEEAYTSKSSFLDRDPLPVYEKGVSHAFSGKRIGRGRYRASDGRIINADVNGSGNIGRKVIRDSEIIARLDRSVAATPVRVNPLKFFCV